MLDNAEQRINNDQLPQREIVDYSFEWELANPRTTEITLHFPGGENCQTTVSEIIPEEFRIYTSDLFHGVRTADVLDVLQNINVIADRHSFSVAESMDESYMDLLGNDYLDMFGTPNCLLKTFKQILNNSGNELSENAAVSVFGSVVDKLVHQTPILLDSVCAVAERFPGDMLSIHNQAIVEDMLQRADLEFRNRFYNALDRDEDACRAYIENVAGSYISQVEDEIKTILNLRQRYYEIFGSEVGSMTQEEKVDKLLDFFSDNLKDKAFTSLFNSRIRYATQSMIDPELEPQFYHDLHVALLGRDEEDYIRMHRNVISALEPVYDSPILFFGFRGDMDVQAVIAHDDWQDYNFQDEMIPASLYYGTTGDLKGFGGGDVDMPAYSVMFNTIKENVKADTERNSEVLSAPPNLTNMYKFSIGLLGLDIYVISEENLGRLNPEVMRNLPNAVLFVQNSINGRLSLIRPDAKESMKRFQRKKQEPMNTWSIPAMMQLPDRYISPDMLKKLVE
jgi:hypothetical protein